MLSAQAVVTQAGLGPVVSISLPVAPVLAATILLFLLSILALFAVLVVDLSRAVCFLLLSCRCLHLRASASGRARDVSPDNVFSRDDVNPVGGGGPSRARPGAPAPNKPPATPTAYVIATVAPRTTAMFKTTPMRTMCAEIPPKGSAPREFPRRQKANVVEEKLDAEAQFVWVEGGGEGGAIS